MIIRSLLLVLFSIFLLSSCNTEPDPYQRWTVVNGNTAGNKFSSLTQIDTSNVTQLKVAWTFHTGDVDTAAHSQIQCNPVIINGTLYATSPQLKLFALDAATGKEKWYYNPFDSISGEKKGV
ncbi:MAG TPA: PQQ-binding-like beta-propeller repeat protein, partial [Puia sp.]